MSTKTKESEPSKINTPNQSTPQDHSLGDPSPGFQLVAIGLVGYIFYTAKFITFTWLLPVSIALVVIGFILLIIKSLGKIKFH